MILRGLAGLLIGSGYGLVVGAITFFLVWTTTDRPGPMIPDNYMLGELVVSFATFIGSVCGAVVGLIVALSRVRKTKAITTGATIGLLIFLYFFVPQLSVGISELSWPMWKDLLKIFFVLLIFLPIGLGLTGMFVSMIVHTRRKFDRA